MVELYAWLLLTLIAAVIGVLMPMDVSRSVPTALAIVWGPIIAAVAPALVSTVGGLFANRSANKASERAQQAQTAATDKALEWEKERDERARKDAERVEIENAKRWQDEVLREQRNLDRSFAEDTFRDRRLDPYREAGREAVADLSARSRNSMRDLPGLGRV